MNHFLMRCTALLFEITLRATTKTHIKCFIDFSIKIRENCIDVNKSEVLYLGTYYFLRITTYSSNYDKVYKVFFFLSFT